MRQAPFVYVITTDNFWPSKIGAAEDPQQRLLTLQIGYWERLHVFAALRHHLNYQIENIVKITLRHKKLIGEWFDIAATDMTKEVMSLYNKYENKPFGESEYKSYPYPLDKLRVNSDIEEDGCWIWKGAQNSGGYGVISLPNGLCAVHRLAWLEYNEGPLPPKFIVRNHCKNRLCWNPLHLYLSGNKTVEEEIPEMLK